jgi:hypothetical protein
MRHLPAFFPFVKFPGVKFLWMSGFAIASMPSIKAERHALRMPDFCVRNSLRLLPPPKHRTMGVE